jgi:hypothetical protein
LFANQFRRTVTAWIQFSCLTQKFRNFFYHLPPIGHNKDNLLHRFLIDLLTSYRHLIDGLIGIRLVADDTTTKRYGKKIEGCGWHHNATPGGTDSGGILGLLFVLVS